MSSPQDYLLVIQKLRDKCQALQKRNEGFQERIQELDKQLAAQKGYIEFLKKKVLELADEAEPPKTPSNAQ
jgi:chromosome segregation ATPase